jgi:hypothetical protein
MSQLNFRYGWIIKGGQKYFTPHHEKSSRDKNFEVEGSETFPVGHAHVRKESRRRRRVIRRIPESWRAPRFSEDTAREIPPPGFISGEDRL